MKKENKLFKGKSKWIVISTIIFAVLGITALVVGFGIANGWASVLAWFGSRWAMYVYIAVGIIVVVAVWLFFKKKIGGE